MGIPSIAARQRQRSTRNVGDAVRAATLALVDDVGINGVNMRTIAKRVGVTHVALYRHFASKEALLATIAEQGFGILRDRIVAAVASTRDPLEGLHRIGLAYVDFAKDNRAHFRLMYARELSVREAYPGLAHAAAAALMVVLDVIDRGQKTAEIVDGNVVELAMTAWALVHGLAVLIAEDQIAGSGVRLDHLVHTATARLRAGLASPARRTGKPRAGR